MTDVLLSSDSCADCQMNRKVQGVTLIELIIAIAVLAILLAVAVPSFRITIQNNRLATQANDLLTAFQLARSEAIRRNGPITICASSDGDSCGGTWQSGWIVFDPNAVGSGGDPEPAIRVWGAMSGETTVAGASSFTFEARGRTTAGGSLTLAVPECTTNQIRRLDVSASGRVYVEPQDCP